MKGAGGMKTIDRRSAAGVLAGVLLGASLLGNAVLLTRARALETAMQMQRQREMTDIADAMSDIEINLQKLLIATGARQSAALLSETALLAKHVETGLARLPLDIDAAAGAMKFAGQMGQYALTLAGQVSGGGMITGEDERQIGGMLEACQALSGYLTQNGEQMYSASADVASLIPGGEDTAIAYPSLIYDGPFSDGLSGGAPKGLTGERITREQARLVAARAAGTTADRVTDAADSGGAFESFGFAAQTAQGSVNVQITGQGGHVLWMMPERAEFRAEKDEATCLQAARVWLADVGFGEMEPCFVQAYDGMVVANFAAVQDGVLIYPDQVKVQVSMESGTVVGAECTQYLRNHAPRSGLMPDVSMEEAEQMVSGKLDIRSIRLSLIPTDGGGERLCWGVEGEHQGAAYFVFIDAKTGETADILRVVHTQQGEMAV